LLNLLAFGLLSTPLYVILNSSGVTWTNPNDWYLFYPYKKAPCEDFKFETHKSYGCLPVIPNVI
jgi:hypothetical protein